MFVFNQFYHCDLVVLKLVMHLSDRTMVRQIRKLEVWSYPTPLVGCSDARGPPE